MSLTIQDFKLIAAILADPTKATPKRTHRWPSGKTLQGFMRNPRVTEGTEHMVYETAPYGRYGNPFSPPLIVVYVEAVLPSHPYEWTDDEMPYEGFNSVEAYGVWWDATRRGHNHYKPWPEMQDEPFWVVYFTPKGRTQYYEKRLEQWAKEIGLVR